MSTNRTIDLAVKETFPQPVAAAWRKALVTTSNTARVKALFDYYEVLLRTLAAYFILDYLRGSRSTSVEDSFHKLDKPSHGTWLGLIRDSLRVIRQRPEVDGFFPEASDWYFDRKGKPTAIVRKMEALVTLRNRWVHGELPSGEEANSKLASALFDDLRAIGMTLSWLPGYRLFRLQELRRQRGRDVHVKAKASFYMGEDETPIPASISIGANLLTDAMYLASPCGERVLEVTPFIRVEHDDQDQPRLFLLRSTAKSKMVVLHNDGLNATKKVLIETDLGDQPFDTWVAREDHGVLFIENGMPEAGLQAPDFGASEGLVLGEGRFHVRGKLGEGGMAVVYHVVDDWVGEEFALKVLRKDLSNDRNIRERFKREARTMKRVRSPYVLSVAGVGAFDDGQMWLTMPIVAGGNLRDRLSVAPPAPELAHQWLTDMIRAVLALHDREAPIVHRDIKPSNFLLGDNDSLLLTDFGIAYEENQGRLTRTMEKVGSTSYMSPEQRHGKEKIVGTPSDIYSLGVVFHEVLTGEEGPADPGLGIEGVLGDLVRAMTAADPAARPSATEVLASLEQPLEPKNARQRAQDETSAMDNTLPPVTETERIATGLDLNNLTKEQYKSALRTKGVLTKRSIELLRVFATTTTATATELAELLGIDHFGGVNSLVGQLGKRIANELEVQAEPRKWWKVIAHGKQTSGGFAWTIKDELLNAALELGLLEDSAETNLQSELFPDDDGPMVEEEVPPPAEQESTSPLLPSETKHPPDADQHAKTVASPPKKNNRPRLIRRALIGLLVMMVLAGGLAWQKRTALRYEARKIYRWLSSEVHAFINTPKSSSSQTTRPSSSAGKKSAPAKTKQTEPKPADSTKDSTATAESIEASREETDNGSMTDGPTPLSNAEIDSLGSERSTSISPEPQRGKPGVTPKERPTENRAVSAGKKRASGTVRIGGDPIILGALDKSLIDAVIKDQMNQIRYCYERELSGNSDLSGNMTVKFVISKTGSVSKASTKSSTLDNNAVENCINGRFLKFKFPEPKGGGIVIVSYPFIFHPG